MEYILQNTDIFDEDIGVIFETVLIENLTEFEKGKVYKLTVSFLQDLTKDSEWLHLQLDSIDQILKNNKIEVDTIVIEGNKTEIEKTVRIIMTEENSESFNKDGNKKERLKFYIVIPHEPSEQAIKNMNRTFFNICRERYFAELMQDQEN